MTQVDHNQPSGVFITGTDTGVGKTWVSARLIQQLLQRGVHVIPRKPVESGCASTAMGLAPADAAALHIAAGRPCTLDLVCPYRFAPALSPDRAARLAGSDLTVKMLADACRYGVEGSDFLLIEGAGGFYSPIANDGLNADLAQALDFPIIIIAEDKLGCINHVLLTREAIRARGLTLTAVVLNQIQTTEEGQMNNGEDLSRLIHEPVSVIGHNADATIAQTLGYLAETLIAGD